MRIGETGKEKEKVEQLRVFEGWKKIVPGQLSTDREKKLSETELWRKKKRTKIEVI